MSKAAETPTFKIGAVSRITGIAAETLRMWERRYTVVRPRRATGNARLYSRDDIARLSMIKQLVDSGHGIGSVASLSRAQLEERLELHRQQAEAVRQTGEAVHPSRLMVYGEALPFLLGNQSHPGLDALGFFNDREEFQRALTRGEQSAVVVELPVIEQGTEQEIKDLVGEHPARDTIIVYGYGHPRTVATLEVAGFTLLRAPVNLADIANAAAASATAPVLNAIKRDLPEVDTAGIPPRRYDNRTLGSVARLAPTVECECPQHIVELIVRLNAFEDYSANCESSSEEDAALHRFLHVTTAKARQGLEEALCQLAEAENIPLEAEPLAPDD